MRRRSAGPDRPADRDPMPRSPWLSVIRSDGVGPRRRAAPTLPADPGEARALLLGRAEQCFERYGLERTTMDDIAEAAGVSRPTLYRYFGDRDTLVREIAMRRVRALTADTHRVLAGVTGTLSDRLVEGLLFLAERIREDQFCRSLIQPEATEVATQLLMDRNGVGVRIIGDLWGPVLTQAVHDGELREGLDHLAAYQWLAYTNLVLAGWLDHEDLDLEWCRNMLRCFVVPAFLAPAQGLTS